MFKQTRPLLHGVWWQKRIVGQTRRRNLRARKKQRDELEMQLRQPFFTIEKKIVGEPKPLDLQKIRQRLYVVDPSVKQLRKIQMVDELFMKKEITQKEFLVEQAQKS